MNNDKTFVSPHLRKSQFLVSLFFGCLLCFSCYETTELKKCNPKNGRFIRGQHFISEDFLNDDKKIDYFKLHKYLKDESKFRARCIPLEPAKSFEEILKDLEEANDLNR